MRFFFDLLKRLYFKANLTCMALGTKQQIGGQYTECISTGPNQRFGRWKHCPAHNHSRTARVSHLTHSSSLRSTSFSIPEITDTLRDKLNGWFAHMYCVLNEVSLENNARTLTFPFSKPLSDRGFLFWLAVFPDYFGRLLTVLRRSCLSSRCLSYYSEWQLELWLFNCWISLPTRSPARSHLFVGKTSFFAAGSI